MQIDLANALTIGGIILAIIGALIKMLRDADMKRIAILEKSLSDIIDKMKEINADERSLKHAVEQSSNYFNMLSKRLDEIDRKIAGVYDKFSDGFDAQREAIADVRETIAGFGGTYVTRKEYAHDMSEKD